MRRVIKLLENSISSVRDVAGVFKSELLATRQIVSVYSFASKGHMIRKLASSPLLAMPLWASKVTHTPRHQRAMTFWGEHMNVILPESGSISIATAGILEYELTKWMLQTIKPGTICLDVGAHFGYFTLLMSHLVGPSGQVHAFEPSPGTFLVLRSNAASHGNIITKQFACYSSNGTRTLSEYGYLYSGFNTLLEPRMAGLHEKSHAEVRTLRLDDYCESQGIAPGFVKIDAEGSELEILKGMKQLISTHRPTISLEVGDFVSGATPSKTLVEHLTSQGYRSFVDMNGKLTKHRPQLSYAYGNILFIPTRDARPF